MRLFEFDEVSADLERLPLSACRALDAVGLKLSQEAFAHFSVQQRQELVRLGSTDTIDLVAVEQLVAQATPQALRSERRAEPSAEAMPNWIADTLGPERVIPLKVWEELEGIERYALMEVCESRHEPRLTRAFDEIIGARKISTHLRVQGGVQMVSVTKKTPQERTAIAASRVCLSPESFARLQQATVPKGDVLATARIAGLMATKRTADLIPLCHPLALTHADVDFELDSTHHCVEVRCTTTVIARTGVEMEAMLGASIAALTIYDMLKSIDRGISIGPTELLIKQGGRSGTWKKDLKS